MFTSIYDLCLKLHSNGSPEEPEEEEEEEEKEEEEKEEEEEYDYDDDIDDEDDDDEEEEEEEDHDSGILARAARMCFLVRFALCFELRRCLRQRLPRVGQLGFPSKLLRRFLRGFAVATAHGLVTVTGGVRVTASNKFVLRNRIFARVMSGFVVREEGQLQAAAAARIAGKSGVRSAARRGDIADVLSYLITRANCVNKCDE
jgi:hypothetical protein